MAIKVCVAGVTGWTGQAVARSIIDLDDLELCSGIARRRAGEDIGEVLGTAKVGTTISPTVADGLRVPCDVFVDYTSAASVKDNVMTALSKGVNVVVGSSGLKADDFREIENAANERGLGVISCGNFSITAALAKHFSLLAAKYLPQWEIIDYASAGKMDVPSGTTQELAEELAQVKRNKLGRPLDELHGPKEARGAQIASTPVHSIRLPSYVISFETIFGLTNERLTIRHDSGSGAEPYVDGTLLAIRKVQSVKGLIRGLDRLLFHSES
ncbi:MAG: 4-hydroxy-tetrahydrodipicolinate reductase [Candidatus Obscuribacterales bacterium]|nr:4-hydroxy-tetrahydrodipicolinate reductase [Candidatus Obscuribacterales bacterium]